MTAIHRERAARKDHECGWGCGVPIKAGKRYVMSSLTPGDPEIGNVGWQHSALHGLSLMDCPPYRRGGSAWKEP